MDPMRTSKASLSSHGPAYAITFGVSAALGLLVALLMQPGCTNQQCTVSGIGDVPSPSFECPAGQLCYQGGCIRACVAGQERGEACTSDAQCSGARPRCIDGYCSICEGGEYCVPNLNICRAVTEVDFGPQPSAPNARPRHPVPLDGGPLDGATYPFEGLKPNRDAGSEEPLPEVEITHAGYVDVAHTVDYRSGTGIEGRELVVNAFDVRGNGAGRRWRADTNPPAIEELIAEMGNCLLRRLRVVTATTGAVPAPVNLGSILIDSHPEYPDSMLTTVRATFSSARPGYLLDPPQPTLPSRLYRPSAPGPYSYLTVSSAGQMDVTRGSWPAISPGTFLGHQGTARLEASEATRALLSSRRVVADPPAEDLVFRFGLVETGLDSFNAVVVRVVGGGHELACRLSQGERADSITLNAAMLQALRLASGRGTRTIYFERASAMRPTVPAADGYVIHMTVRVRHTLIGELELE